jgi:hypothetical protein
MFYDTGPRTSFFPLKITSGSLNYPITNLGQLLKTLTETLFTLNKVQEVELLLFDLTTWSLQPAPRPSILAFNTFSLIFFVNSSVLHLYLQQ